MAEQYTPSAEDEPYVAQAWRMEGYYAESWAEFMARLGIGIDYEDDDAARYEAKFRADLAAHDAQVLRDAALSGDFGTTAQSTLLRRADRIAGGTSA